MNTWWNSSQNTTLNESDEDREDAEYWERVKADAEAARQRQEACERRLAEEYYGQ